MKLATADLYHIANILWDLNDEGDGETYDLEYNRHLIKRIETEINRQNTRLKAKID